MNWQNIPDGYEFKIYFNHGDATSNVVETINCNLQDEKFEKIVNILEYIVAAIEEDLGGNINDVAKFISQKTGYNEEEVYNIVRPIIKCDIKWIDLMAVGVNVEVYRYENNTVQKADIENKYE